MARTKEACMLILDVGKDTVVKSGKNDLTFFERAKGCVTKIVQRSKPHDEVGLVLMGTDDTSNQLNVECGGYEHIAEAFELGPSNWKMLRILESRIQPSIACMVDQSHQGDVYGWKSFLDEVLLREGVEHADGVAIRIECIELDVVHFGVNCHDYRPLLLLV
ncbi:hypothetical protein pipiens_010376 [Culex pipiens pipiens]|uniref:Ku70/Ku80 N-terminal alpha/beta domain-containing protein n=1 Tax=Culex pipiens pipiens TaxID=38569 RepID=A0ABD1DAF9_CULPP